MISKILQWAKHEKLIRAVILTGSRAADNHDELSDYDLSIFCSQTLPYICDDRWLNEIGSVWVCVHEKKLKNKQFPTRLVVFENGIKVDFAFLSIDLIKQIVSSKSLPCEYDMGYEVLIDKNSNG